MTLAPSVPPRADGPSPVLVSVVIPTHNFGRYIEEAVGSVLSQDIDSLEVIVMDDGSTDDTAERLARITDPRLIVSQLPKVGVGAARNAGIRLARGRYLAFLDSDDRWRPDKLRRQLAILESEPTVGFVFTNFVRFDDHGFHPQTQFDLVPDLARLATRPSRAGDGRVIEHDTFSALTPLPQLPCWTQTMLARSDLVREIVFPADMRLSQDLYYVLNVYRVARGAFINEPLVEIRRHAGNSYRRADEKVLPDIDALTRTLGTVTEASHRHVLRRRLGRAWLAAGYHHFWSNEPRRAAQAYWHAVRYPGARRRALTRLLATPLAPLIARRRDTKAFPSERP
jgi:glycosyltransferase involved in cell wall biosynthesis